QFRATALPASFVEIDKPAQSCPAEQPLAFEASQGQANCGAQFLSRTNEFSLLLKPTEAAVRLRNSDPGLRNRRASLAQRLGKAPIDLGGLNSALYALSSAQSAGRGSQSAELR